MAAPSTLLPIRHAYCLDGSGVPLMGRDAEAATQTFKMGAPLVLSSGNLIECAFSSADIVYGFSLENGHNLTTADTAEGLNDGSVPNQTSAIVEPIGARVRDGKIGFVAADGQNVFVACLEQGKAWAESLKAAGTSYGLTKDGTTGLWYIDTTDTTGNNAVCKILGNYDGAPSSVTMVYFQVIASKRYFE